MSYPISTNTKNNQKRYITLYWRQFRINWKSFLYDIWIRITIKSRSINKQGAAIILSLTAAFLFLIISSTRLDLQGLYYDELHQATASFAYIGRIPNQIPYARLIIDGIPVMNMTYSAAIKSAIYGLYLRVSGAKFSVTSWRLVGILCVSVALLLFGLIVRKTLTFVGLFSFYFFMITDLTVLLTTRHDWGPVALALSIRLLLIATWIRGELSNDTPAKNSFWLGFMFGISVFEKLSSIILIFPIFFMVMLSSKRRNRGHILASIIGVVIGAIPLIFVNIYSFYHDGVFISLEQVMGRTNSISSLLVLVTNYLSLGAGETARNFILGKSQHIFSIFELVQIALIILLMIIVISQSMKASNTLRLAGIMLLCYGTIIIGLYFLPQITEIHHWIIGTPFQYSAIVLFLSGLKIKKESFRQGFVVLLVTISFSRLFGLVSVEQSLLRGDATMAWDPSLTKIGEFAASKSKTAYFIAGDWGVGDQMICFLNGKPGIVYETFWTEEGVENAVNAVKNGKRSEVYLVFPKRLFKLTPETRSIEIQYIENSLRPAWQEQTVKGQLARLNSVDVIKLVKTTPP